MPELLNQDWLLDLDGFLKTPEQDAFAIVSATITDQALILKVMHRGFMMRGTKSLPGN